jgi:hypothetical protein
MTSIALDNPTAALVILAIIVYLIRASVTP